MKGRLYAEFMERRGRHVFEGAGCYWYDAGCQMIMSIPYHEEMNPSTQEIRALLRAHKRLGARYLTHRGGLPGGLYVRPKSPYGISSIDRRARNQVRRGLAQCIVREVEKKELRSQGLRINLDTMERQGRFEHEFGEERPWSRFVDAAYESRGVTVWGAFVGRALAAYVVALTEDRWTHLLYQFSGARWLAEYFPNHALTFGVTKAGMEDPAIDAISYGVAGLVQTEGLHRYKLHHAYQFIPFGYAFVLRPAAHFLLANAVSTWGIRTAHRLRPNAQLFKRIGSVVEGARSTPLNHLLRPKTEPAQEIHRA
jgi:hypothetical protein